ncbi:Rad4-domain-containing protein [Xylaria sp. CBS 124048]|nr:Rad4-domain-containing protein [Xylaria sp. CBS 124048]
MAGPRRRKAAPTDATGRASSQSSHDQGSVPDFLFEMLGEANVQSKNGGEERPLKRRRPNQGGHGVAQHAPSSEAQDSNTQSSQTARATSGSSKPTQSRHNQGSVPAARREMFAPAEVQPAKAEEERAVQRRRTNRGLARDVQSSGTQSLQAPSSERQASPEQLRHKKLFDIEERQDEDKGKGKSVDKDDSQDHYDNDDNADNDDNGDVDDIEFEDVVFPPATTQTVYRDSDDEEDADVPFENDDFSAHMSNLGITQDAAQDLELDLSAHTEAKQTSALASNRRKPMGKSEKDHRLEVHKTHLLCLLAHVSRRNKWCNDHKVEESLRPLLTPKMIELLTPFSHRNPFSVANSQKEGLKLVNTMFKLKFRITERGMRRALWAEKEEHLQDYQLPEDSEGPMKLSDFREAAKTLSGSRDVGAQLYCALLRAAGVTTRLVCSLQPLSFGSGGPYLGKSLKRKRETRVPEKRGPLFAPSTSTDVVSNSPSLLSPHSRLGHPNAAAYQLPEIGPAPSRKVMPAHKVIGESKYPVYWVEILDRGHWRWQASDPLVTGTYWKAYKLEPPASEPTNCMSYVVGFERDGVATDVTRRYAKTYNAKTRKMRVESVTRDGEKWWSKALEPYSLSFATGLSKLEATQLAAIEASEPLPCRLVDYKDHHFYVLKQHLRQHEVLAPNTPPVGTFKLGGKGPRVNVYERARVRIAKSRDKWYRLGREVRPNEIPVKFIVKPSQLYESLFVEEEPEAADGGTVGTPVYIEDQTELYKAPPVRNGKVPKNKFGNVDLYVPSMVPEGGVHIDHKYAAEAALLTGVDFAPALVGFQFNGKKGTAVLRGVVLAAEYEEAVRAVMAGLDDVKAELEEEETSRRALGMWKSFLMRLRIRQRIWAGADEVAEAAEQKEAEAKQSKTETDEEVHDEQNKWDQQNDEDEDTVGGFFQRP